LISAFLRKRELLKFDAFLMRAAPPCSANRDAGRYREGSA
jgi:hypothetical protein